MSATPKAYIVSLVEVGDVQTYQEYIQRSAALVAAFGGSFVIKGGEPETLEGGAFTPSRIVILEFNSPEAARAFYSSPEYQEAAAFRRQGAESMLFLAKGA